MSKNEYIEDVNNANIKISKDVLLSIAAKAISSIEGVELSNTGGGIADIINRKNISKGIKVEIKDSDVTIDLFISVKYGYKVNEVGYDIQNKVKDSIEQMTDLNVKEINVHIENLITGKEEISETIDND
ncbi:Asp23/Gls24 family envelope stress response protein [Soehngenia longivitae]|uniref:Asp23/Gls24 family envelope stress response protein n=1 Tax=Soehngenia longivitae TaxID=2562294 RepID=A0A4Z0D5A2_9FIRM|nr:Asp23/Gls24 family envelope stress response protein [Soehngenia longivitae]TFZ39752.1 Asp23/Gls24 family envelope stress response protein [Soehngenia longivitae]